MKPEPRTKVWHGYNINDSSNVLAVMWVKEGMVVRFKSDTAYLYKGVSRQRAVACARAKSVGVYINKVIKPNFEAVRTA
jgi:hypothetical protein